MSTNTITSETLTAGEAAASIIGMIGDGAQSFTVQYVDRSGALRHIDPADPVLTTDVAMSCLWAWRAAEDRHDVIERARFQVAAVVD